GHIRRVAELTLRIAQKINETSDGLFADTGFNADQLKEIRLAGWLHDIGKITTPEFVVDKSTKLSTISDGIVTVKTRLELLKRDAEIAFLKEWIGHCLEEGHTEKPDALEGQFQERCRQLDEDGAFLNEINYGGEYLAEDKIDRIGRIARNRWFLNGEEQPLLSEQEVTNLAIRRGTLNNEERKKIENHAAVTLTMLSALPFPKKIKNVPSIAASHHERIDGRGYPRGLSGDQLPLQARIIALADVFEALTAKRPYKSAKKISEVMRIMAMMVKDNHLDRDLFRFFIEEKLFLAYAEENLATDQQDEVDFDFLLDQQ
ncbi:MAG: HD domain-containing protein, partial [Nitrospirae bacterium]|nr:HD domain-containing protein [Candidatus Troglogloeales bacterium]